MRGPTRLAVTMVAVVLALILQVAALPRFGWPDAGIGVVPGLVLLVVVATALAHDTRFATLVGFCAGLLLDLAPPADHVAGRWALALTVVGYVVGRLSHDYQSDPASADRRPGLGVVLAAAAGGSFVGTSVFALSGVLLGDAGAGFGELLSTALLATALDTLAALVVVPALFWVNARVSSLGAPDAGRVSPRTVRRTVL
ncbi:rod shape-determining protein MreD [Nocardioides sp. GY 10113]|uniref:rod shape-determining protein MreD n=1 Tax=Nocardioides sp. GY 10113 TaxID=2569761 RepID=UPI0010A8DFA6|nr:rod shape-determining protein MreD [Nocardioides sp. GY 10113]TIC87934.1 rod shape-determining protein MreD [Nocardioides sp. GY 10113]